MPTDTEIENEARAEIDKHAINLSSALGLHAARLRRLRPELAGRLYVLRADLGDGVRDLFAAWPDPAPAAAPESAPRRARAAGEHRHKFDPATNRCMVAGCGKLKSGAGRKPAPEGEKALADNRTGRLLLGDGAADRFADGSMGSSGRAG